MNKRLRPDSIEPDHQPIADRTKPLRVPLALSLAGVALALGLSGCASGATSTTTPTSATESTAPSAADPLQSYIDANRSTVEAEMERYSDIYSNFSIEAKGVGTLVYRYTFRNQLDPVQAESNIAALEHTLKTMAADVILPEMKSAGIEDPTVRWVYHNPDGTVVTTFEEADY